MKTTYMLSQSELVMAAKAHGAEAEKKAGTLNRRLVQIHTKAIVAALMKSTDFNISVDFDG